MVATITAEVKQVGSLTEKILESAILCNDPGKNKADTKPNSPSTAKISDLTVSSPPCDHVYSKSPECEPSTSSNNLDPSSNNKKRKSSTIITSNDENSLNSFVIATKPDFNTQIDNQKKKRKRRKFFPDSNESNSILTADNDNVPRFAKVKSEIYPPLTQRQIDLLLIFLNNPNVYYDDENFLLKLMSNQEVKLPFYLLPQMLRMWHKILSKRKVHGIDTLCLLSSKKLILPKEKYEHFIGEAHLGTGNFIWSNVSRDEKGRTIHNSYFQTLKLIKTDYGVGYKEFGMSTYQIYEYIANCSECSIQVKKLPAISKVLPASTSSDMLTDDLGPNSVYPDPDALNESKYIDLSDAPLTMLWPQPSAGSIWHDQQGLAAEKCSYSKLIGVISELSLELGDMVQGNTISKEKFITKLYCVVRLVKEEKDRLVDLDKKLDGANFLHDYLILQKKYVDIGKLDLFLYDVNLLVIKYNLTKNEKFMKMVNNCVRQFNLTDNQHVTESLSVKPQSPLTTKSSFVSLNDIMSMKQAAQKLHPTPLLGPTIPITATVPKATTTMKSGDNITVTTTSTMVSEEINIIPTTSNNILSVATTSVNAFLTKLTNNMTSIHAPTFLNSVTTTLVSNTLPTMSSNMASTNVHVSLKSADTSPINVVIPKTSGNNIESSDVSTTLKLPTMAPVAATILKTSNILGTKSIPLSKNIIGKLDSVIKNYTSPTNVVIPKTLDNNMEPSDVSTLELPTMAPVAATICKTSNSTTLTKANTLDTKSISSSENIIGKTS